VSLSDALWMKGLVLMGVGWCGYQEGRPNCRSRFMLRRMLSKDRCHAVRDEYTLAKRKEIGIRSVNTGCPTLWRLSEEHCRTIPCEKSDAVIFTFTEYNQEPKQDAVLFDTLKRNYRRLFFWPQMYGDYAYARELCGDSAVYLDPSLKALDDCLATEQVEFVGTRLHAGIRAMQHSRRSIIVAIDNRATEMGADFGLPVVSRDEVGAGLHRRINESWDTHIRLDQKAIGVWRDQFAVKKSFG
jgi:polysaccharide pyruvyl transferase WcaK-like protein